MTFIKRLTLAAAGMAAAASLAGCALGPRPFSIEEKIWFDKAVGYDIIPVQPTLPDAEFAPPPYAPPYAPLSSRN